MASLKIPDEALPDLKKIAEIDDAAFSSFHSVVRNALPTLRPFQFEQLIASKVTSISRQDIHSILGAIFFLYKLKERRALVPQELSDAVVNSSLISDSEAFSSESKETLKNRLNLLLDLNKSLGVTAKALDVMTEHDKIFCSARILSDIRPIFSGDPKEASAAVIIHNLQIGFHRNGDHEEIYLALDTDDIQMLKDVIERAEQKTHALQSVLTKSQLPYLEV